MNLDKLLRSVRDGHIDGRRHHFATSFGETVVPALGEALMTATTRMTAFVAQHVFVLDKWPVPPRPWYWKNRATRWFLRRVLRRLPPLTFPPLVYQLEVNDAVVLRVPAMLADSYGIIDLGGDLVIPPTVKLQMRVLNAGPEPLWVSCSVGGWSVG